MKVSQKPGPSKGARNRSGHAMSEFAAALIVLISFIFMPLLNISIIPVRYLMAQGVLNELSHRVVLCDKRSEASAMFAGDGSVWSKSLLSKCGVTVSNPKLTLTIFGKEPADKLVVLAGDTIPAEWLQDGAKAPNLYSMELSADCAIAPFVECTPGLPGFTSPITMRLKAASPWENFGRDPATQEYYVNE